MLWRWQKKWSQSRPLKARRWYREVRRAKCRGRVWRSEGKWIGVMGGLPSLMKRTRKQMQAHRGCRLRRHRFATQRRCWCGCWPDELVALAPLALLRSRVVVKRLALRLTSAHFRTPLGRCSIALYVMRLGVVGGLSCSCLFRMGRCCLQPCVDARS